MKNLFFSFLVSILGFASFHAVMGSKSWQTIKPGGSTICGLGGEYAFFYREGTTNSDKLVVEFEGGGACWNAATCGLGTFKSSISVDATLLELYAMGGIHSDSDSRNAFAGWNHLYVPYCTADAHGGNNTMKYSGWKTVHHMGRANALSALDWVFGKVKSPSIVATVGCSAGSLGAIVNAPYIMNNYPSARNFYWGDSYVGVLTNEQFADGLHNWKLTMAPFISGLSYASLDKVAANKTQDSGLYIIKQTIAAFPKWHFASYTSDADAVQTSFYGLGGGNVLGWSKYMRTLISSVHEVTSQYYTFIASGIMHCRSQDSGFFGVETKGRKLYEWLQALASDKMQPGDQRIDCCD